MIIKVVIVEYNWTQHDIIVDNKTKVYSWRTRKNISHNINYCIQKSKEYKFWKFKFWKDDYKL